MTRRYCPTDRYCSGAHALIDEGLFVSLDRVTFRRWWCSECGASRPEGSALIVER